LSEKQKVIKLFLGITTAIMVFALVTSVIKILPSQSLSPQFPSFNVSWTISVDALKNSPLLGVGPGNYLTAFNMFKPLSYNTSNLWAVKFATANNFYLTLLTEAGLLAFAAIIFLFISIYKTVRRELKEQKLVNWGFAPISNLAALCVLILAMLFFPATILTLVVFYLYLSLSTKSKPTTLNLTTQGVQDQTNKATTSRFPALLIGIPVIVAVGFIGFKSANILIAEQKFTSALDMLVANDALKTYETLREAIRINPYVDRYHTTFARVNLALANSIAQKASENAAEDAQISDADRQNIAVLIQQAISEGKSAVALNQLRSGNWETLAGIYRTIIPLTKGADNFALQSYRQAITLDPFNPNLRIFLGGIYYSQKDYDNAIKMFDSAVAAKTDHANAHYNLAFALRDNNNLDRAVQELTLVLSLIPDKNSQDYQVAKTALDNIEAKIKTEAEPGEELTPPQGEESSEIQPPIEIPEGSEPPEISVTPTPTGNQVSPTPTVSVTPTPTS
jgi:tetratricopeptide (TPR) repeat protein